MNPFITAVKLASRGYYVFPVSASKVPLVRWTVEATNVPALLPSFPWKDAASVGVDIRRSGLFVLDNDGDRSEFDAKFPGLFDAGHPMRGGRHAWFADGGQTYRRDCQTWRPVDALGKGMVIVHDGAIPPPPAELPAVPEGFSGPFLERPKPNIPREPFKAPVGAVGTAKGQSILENKLFEMKKAWQRGYGRGQTFNACGYRLGGLVRRGELDRRATAARIRQFIAEHGVGEWHTKQLRSGWMSGLGR